MVVSNLFLMWLLVVIENFDDIQLVFIQVD